MSGTIAATNNGASIYLEAKKKPDMYLTDKGTPMKDDISHAPLGTGAGGHFNLPGPFIDMVMGYSPKPEGRPRTFCAGSTPSRSSSNGSPRSRATPMAPPKCGRTTRCGTSTRSWSHSNTCRVPGGSAGYAGPPGQKAAEVQTKYIIVDMYAKAVQGMKPEDAVKWATW